MTTLTLNVTRADLTERQIARIQDVVSAYDAPIVPTLTNGHTTTVTANRRSEHDLGGNSSDYYAGSRKVFDVVGYPRTLVFTDYLGRYQRGDIAAAVVDAKPAETWRLPPVVLDGADKQTAVDSTPFVTAWRDLLSTDDFDAWDADGPTDTKTLWHYCARIDVLAGIGEYAVMLLGFDDGLPLDQPVKQRPTGGKLLYVSTYHQDNAKILDSDLNKNPASRRFGLPTFYQINFGQGVGTLKVHHTRIIHVAEGLLHDELYGTPRMKAVYNRLIDIEKALASSGETAWRMTQQKIVVSTKDGYTLGEGTVTTAKVEDMLHNLRDVVSLEGMDTTVIAGQSVDPWPLVEANVKMIAATTRVPTRKLIGSEQGELASGQDEGHWNDMIAARQSQFAEPTILRPLLYRLVWAGVLPPPSSGRIYCDWPSLYQMSDQEAAGVASIYADVFNKMAAPGVEMLVDLPTFLRTYIRGLPADAIPDEIEILREEMNADGTPVDELDQSEEDQNADDSDPSAED